MDDLQWRGVDVTHNRIDTFSLASEYTKMLLIYHTKKVQVMGKEGNDFYQRIGLCDSIKP